MTTLFREGNIAIQAITGSHNYNLNTPASDIDCKIFVIPTFEEVYSGLRFSHSRQTADFDYTVHDIRSFSEQLWKSNLNFLEVLYSRDVTFDVELFPLFENRDSYATMNLWAFYNSTYGMHLEKMKSLHKGTATTAALVEKFGYDTKQACHAMRCLYVLERFTHTQDMGAALWFDNDSRYRCALLKIKAGEFTETQFRHAVEVWHAEKHADVKAFFEGCEPDNEAKDELDAFMMGYIKAGLTAPSNNGFVIYQWFNSLSQEWEYNPMVLEGGIK